MQLTKSIHLFERNGVFPGPKRSDVSKNPRYVDTRVDELFPVRKNSIRLNLISRKENVSLLIVAILLFGIYVIQQMLRPTSFCVFPHYLSIFISSLWQESFPAEQSGSIKKSSVPSAFPAENQQQLKL